MDTQAYELPITKTTTTAPDAKSKGVVRLDKYGNRLKLVKVRGSTVAANRGCALGYYSGDSNNYTVTPDLSQSSSLLVAGAFLGSLSAANVNSNAHWGWMMERGNPGTYCSNLRTDGGVAAGEQLYFAADRQFGGRKASAASINVARIAGIALIADSGSLLNADAAILY